MENSTEDAAARPRGRPGPRAADLLERIVTMATGADGADLVAVAELVGRGMGATSCRIELCSDEARPLAGVYDGRSHRMYLYVNGALAGIRTDPTPVVSTGVLAVGRGFFAGMPTDWFEGSISDVRVYSRALSAREIARL